MLPLVSALGSPIFDSSGEGKLGVAHRGVDLSLGFLFCSLDLYFGLFASTILFFVFVFVFIFVFVFF